MSKRDSFAVVGAALREAIADTLANDPPASVTRVLLALIHEVPSWSRLSDNVTRHQVAKLTGLSERQVTRAVHWLAERDILMWKSGSSTPAGGRISSRVTFFEATGDTAMSPVTPESLTGDKALSSTGDTALSLTGDKALSHYREGFRVVKRGNRTDGVAPDGAANGTRRKSAGVPKDRDEIARNAEMAAERLIATCLSGSWPGVSIDADVVEAMAYDMAEHLSWGDLVTVLSVFDEEMGTPAEGEDTMPGDFLDWLEVGAGGDDASGDRVRGWAAEFRRSAGYQAVMDLEPRPVGKAEAANRLRAMAGQVKRA